MSSNSEIVDGFDHVMKADEPCAILISGKWGVGKTHLWKSHLAKSEFVLKRQGAPFNVTALGANSLDSINKQLLVASFKRTDVGLNDVKNKIVDNAPMLMGGLFGIDLKSAAGIAESALMILREEIICIDDLERKDDDLKISELFGFVEKLVFANRCTVICLVNAHEISSSDKAVFEKLREKIFDYQFEIDFPNIEEYIQLNTLCNDTSELILRSTQALGIVNLRTVIKVLDKTKRIIEIIPDESNKELKEKVCRSLVLFEWIHSERSPDVPTFEYVFGAYREDEITLNKKVNSEWYDLLRMYDWPSTDSFDDVIVEYVTKGYPNKQNIIEEAIEFKSRSAGRRLKDEIRLAWNLYSGSFSINDDEVAGRIIDVYTRDVNDALPLNINAAVDLLRKIGYVAEADKLIDLWVENKYMTSPDLLDRSQLGWFSDVQDVVLIRKMDDKYGSMSQHKSLSQKLDLFSKSKYPRDLESEPFNYTRDDYVKALTEDWVSADIAVVSKALIYFRNTNRVEATRELEAALKLISEQSMVNGLRVESVMKMSTGKED